MTRNKLHVRKGDEVHVLSGNYKGSRGTVLRTIPRKNQVVVEGVNIRKRHEAPSQKSPDGGIVSFAAPIHVSNVIDSDGTKERISVRSGNPIPKA
jgi:large subunit ribosomal protein L24